MCRGLWTSTSSGRMEGAGAVAQSGSGTAVGPPE